MRVSVCVPVTMGTACSSAPVGSANGEIREPQEMAAEDGDFDENGPVVLDLVSFCISFVSVTFLFKILFYKSFLRFKNNVVVGI